MSLEHPDVRQHIWNGGFESGVFFVCQTLKLEPDAYDKLMAAWKGHIVALPKPAKPRVNRIRKKG